MHLYDMENFIWSEEPVFDIVKQYFSGRLFDKGSIHDNLPDLLPRKISIIDTSFCLIATPLVNYPWWLIENKQEIMSFYAGASLMTGTVSVTHLNVDGPNMLR